jgi:hypothetical protein
MTTPALPGVIRSTLRVVAKSRMPLACGQTRWSFFGPDTSMRPALVRISAWSSATGLS